jgi:hypothetical protein
MASTTGIEIGSNACTLAGVRAGAGKAIDVRALATIDGGDWPSGDSARSLLLRKIRRAEGLPRRAVVVSWGLAEPLDDGAARAAVQFVEDAGFTIESVLSPPQALAKAADTRRRLGSPQATAWTALNTDGVAIAILAGRELLFTRTFRWIFRHGLTATRAQLLQRYSLVAHLAPEVRHAIEMVWASHGVVVEGVVTCGNLPDLRSLTMPLMEELDLPVETLDGIDGLRASGRVSPDRLLQAAPAIRLACTAALTSPPQGQARLLDGVTFMQEEPSAIVRVGAAVALIGALIWGAVSFRPLWQAVPVKPPAPVGRYVARPAVPPTQTADPAKPERGEARVAEAKNDSTPVSTVLSVTPAGKTPPPPPTTDRQSPSLITSSSVPGAIATGRASIPGTVNGPAVRQRTVPSDRLQPVALPEPLPRVDSILINQERRLAVIDGAAIKVGDAVGRRTVAGIERDTVLLREPSGLIVRASVRSR